MSKLWSALAIVALALGFLSLEQGTASATQGWYGRVDIGYSTNAEWNFEQPPASTGVIGGTYELDNALMMSGGVGYAFANSVRVEGEISLRDNEFSRYPTSKTKVNAAMANVYYDFNRGGRVEPYVGAGAGLASVSITDYQSDHDALAYQVMAGAAIGLTEQLDLDVGFRHFVIPDAVKQRCLNVCYSVDGEYVHDAVTLGFRYQFEAPTTPAPMPVAAAVPAPAATCPISQFVVYFEWDRSNLNQAALDVIDNAMTRARECALSTATIVGHTDTSGPAAYNIGLSQRRAAVVAEALSARGMPTELIVTEARGETDLAQPTRDGVREPLNRRTAVTITFE